MLSDLKRASRKAGLSPGTVVFTGERHTEQTRISIADFDPDTVREQSDVTPADCAPCLQSRSVSWIDVVGLHDVPALEELGRIFGIHPLVLEDIAHAGQRAKIEVHDAHLFIVLRAMPREADGSLREEQVSFIIGTTFLITFQERPSPIFDTVRQRITSNRGRVRRMGPDYLAYALMDAIVDEYFVALETIGEALETLEDEMLQAPGPQSLETLHDLRGPIMTIRRGAWPMRDVIGALQRGESALFRAATLPFLRDLQDHTVHVMDIVEEFRDMQASLMGLYLSASSQRSNEVMRVLTVIASLFIPLTFVAGVYGMNFQYMPELHWRWGYLSFWAAIGLVTGVQLYFMRRKGWL